MALLCRGKEIPLTVIPRKRSRFTITTEVYEDFTCGDVLDSVIECLSEMEDPSLVVGKWRLIERWHGLGKYSERRWRSQSSHLPSARCGEWTAVSGTFAICLYVVQEAVQFKNTRVYIYEQSIFLFKRVKNKADRCEQCVRFNNIITTKHSFLPVSPSVLHTEHRLSRGDNFLASTREWGCYCQEVDYLLKQIDIQPLSRQPQSGQDITSIGPSCTVY